MVDIVIPLERPSVSPEETTKYLVDLQGASWHAFDQLANHLAGVRFRRACHHRIDWDEPVLPNTLVGVAPTAGPHTHYIPWLSSPMADYIILIIEAQAWDTSAATARIRADLEDITAAVVDNPGCEWTEAAGTLPVQKTLVGASPVYEPIYITTGARIGNPGAGYTDPRMLELGAKSGTELVVKITADYCRVWSVTILEYPAEVVTQ